MWIAFQSAELEIDLESIKLLGASLETNDVSGPVREVRVSFEGSHYQLRLRGEAAQRLWQEAPDWNRKNPEKPIRLVWHGPPQFGPIGGALI